MPRAKSASAVISAVESQQRVFVHGGAATPTRLLEALVADAPRLTGVELIHLHTMGPAPWAHLSYARSFRTVNLFVGSNMRSHIRQKNVDYLPCFLFEIPNLFRSQRRPIDVALLHVSPPDQHGYCTLGTSVDIAHAAVQCARTILAQINPQMPRVHGDGFIHIDQIDRWIEVDDPLPEAPARAPSPEEQAIGKFVASMIEDGATVQAGIGAIPDAALRCLTRHRRLGLHTEMWSDGALELIQCGAVDNSQKVAHPGKTVSGFVMGSRKLYGFAKHDQFK